jgi:hypothetical protein
VGILLVLAKSGEDFGKRGWRCGDTILITDSPIQKNYQIIL